MITSADVLNIAPELGSVAAGTWTAIITDTYLELSAPNWGVKLDLGAKYLAAYKATLLVQTREPYGGKGRTVNSDDALSANQYGREFKRLRSGLATRFALVSA